MVNKMFAVVDEIKHSVELYRENLTMRKDIIRSIKAEVDNEAILNVSAFTPPAVPSKNKSGKKPLKKKPGFTKQLNQSCECAKENRESNFRGQHAMETTESDELARLLKKFNVKDARSSESYHKLVNELKEKIVAGIDEDNYSLRNFEEVGHKLESHLWILKDVFYQ